MESITLEIMRTFLQQIPNGLSLPFAISSLVACFFILIKRRHRRRFYLCFWFLVIFMVFWRTFVGIVATRYVAMLIIPAVMLTAFTGLRMESFWRLLHRKFPVIPCWPARIFPRLLLIGISSGALLMARHVLSSDQDVFVKTYKIIREYRAANPGLTVLTHQNEVIRFSYYTGAKTIGMASMTPETILHMLNDPASRGKDLLFVIRSSAKNKLAFRQSHIPREASLRLLHTVKGKKKRKSVFVYLFTWQKTPPALKTANNRKKNQLPVNQKGNQR